MDLIPSQTKPFALEASTCTVPMQMGKKKGKLKKKCCEKYKKKGKHCKSCPVAYARLCGFNAL